MIFWLALEAAGRVALICLPLLLPPALLYVVVERRFPASHCSSSGIVFNLVYVVPSGILRAVSVSVAAGCAVAVTNSLGGGLITLPSKGLILIPAIAAYTVAMDLGEYAFHRAQHRIPALWAMHSLHHSDEAMNASTTNRHFWAEQAIKSATIYLMIGLLLKSNVHIAVGYGVIGFWNYFAHMNIRVGLGRGWFLLNSPQYHRVHHSSLLEHCDKNFAALFPVFDLICGTAHKPKPDEFPPTGLCDHDGPRNMVEAIIWPVRNWARRADRDWGRLSWKWAPRAASVVTARASDRAGGNR